MDIDTNRLTSHSLSGDVIQTEERLELLRLQTTIVPALHSQADEKQVLDIAMSELARYLNSVCGQAFLYHGPNQVEAHSFISGDIENNIENPYHAYLGTIQQVITEHHTQIQQQLILPYVSAVLLPNAPGMVVGCPLSGFDSTEALMGSLWFFVPECQLSNTVQTSRAQHLIAQCAIAIYHLRRNQTYQNQIRTLQTVSQQKDDLIERVAHELRAPITNMNLLICTLETRLPEGLSSNQVSGSTRPDCLRLERYLTMLRSECSREIDLINHLLDLQRLESNQQSIHLQPIDLNAWLPSIVNPFQEKANARQQSLSMHLEALLPCLLSDPTCVGQIVTELLNNACKYTPPQGTITLMVSMSSAGLQMAIANSGVEIPIHEHSRIFEKFYRIPAYDRWQQGGTGLGLAIVKTLVEQLGGTIEVRSASNVTEFIVTLPSNTDSE